VVEIFASLSVSDTLSQRRTLSRIVERRAQHCDHRIVVQHRRDGRGDGFGQGGEILLRRVLPLP